MWNILQFMLFLLKIGIVQKRRNFDEFIFKIYKKRKKSLIKNGIRFLCLGGKIMSEELLGEIENLKKILKNGKI